MDLRKKGELRENSGDIATVLSISLTYSHFLDNSCFVKYTFTVLMNGDKIASFCRLQ